MFGLCLVVLGVFLLMSCEPRSDDQDDVEHDTKAELATETQDTPEPNTASVGKSSVDGTSADPVVVELTENGLSGANQLDVTQSGFELWEWRQRSDLSAFRPDSSTFLVDIDGASVTSIETTAEAGWIDDESWERYVYDDQGRLTARFTPSPDLGIVHERYTYDDTGRLVRFEYMYGPSDEDMTAWVPTPENDLRFDYFVDSDSDRLFRTSTDGHGVVDTLEIEERQSDSWSYIEDPRFGSPQRLQVEFDHGHIARASTRSTIPRFELGEVLEFIRGDDQLVVLRYGDPEGRRLENRTEYKFEDGVLMGYEHFVVSDDETELASVTEIRAHDTRGNWTELETRYTDGGSVLTLGRTIEYHETP